jgi:hypothetical protein
LPLFLEERTHANVVELNHKDNFVSTNAKISLKKKNASFNQKRLRIFTLPFFHS